MVISNKTYNYTLGLKVKVKDNSIKPTRPNPISKVKTNQ